MERLDIRLYLAAIVLAAATLLLQGCFSYGAPALHREAAAEQAEGAREVEVFYVSDRAATDADGEYYGPERDSPSYGVVAVGIPPNHVIGRHEEPSVFKFEWSADERKHIAVKDVSPLPDYVFFERLSRAVSSSPGGKVLVFVHGYNMQFAEASRLLAQFATDLKFSGPAVLFSWPSQGSLTSYTVDETNAEWAQGDLERLLRDLLDRTPARSVYLIGHSMGGRLIARAFNALASDRPAEDLSAFREMVLVAPDIDADVFREDVAPRLARNGIHVTLYASSSDRALMASKAFHGYPRAGDAGDGLVIVDGVETIDASDASGGLLGHSYFVEDRRIMEDIFALLQAGQRAESRFGLEAVSVDGGRYWIFRK